MNWTQVVEIHERQHQARLTESRARRAANLAEFGTEYPAIARAYPEIHQALISHVWTPEAPIVPDRIKARHPFAH